VCLTQRLRDDGRGLLGGQRFDVEIGAALIGNARQVGF
jgi:hypothetical protein